MNKALALKELRGFVFNITTIRKIYHQAKRALTQSLKQSKEDEEPKALEELTKYYLIAETYRKNIINAQNPILIEEYLERYKYKATILYHWANSILKQYKI